MQLRITVLPGDGIGPEVTAEAVRVLQTIASIQGYRFRFEEYPIGGVAIKIDGSPLPRETLDACLSSDAVLLGAVGAPEYDLLPPHQKPETGLLLLRRALGGYANLRPVVSYPAISSCSPLRSDVTRGADILFVRELLGGLYFGEPRGFSDTNGVSSALNTMTYTVDEIERVAHIAFAAARARRQKVTSVDKANVLENGVLWRKTVTALGAQYPDV
ncbi:MAG: isocitrate/isopropylmalate family dehydrogenase, partial [Pyrinomonadaceae bacterium]